MTTTMTTLPPLTIGSLFSGVGALEMGIQAVIPSRTIWHCEYEPPSKHNPNPTQAAARVLAHHWPEVPNLGDISLVDWSLVQRPDILAGGFPCTDVSLAGARQGLGPDTRSGLWAQFLHAIAAMRPGLVVIENVRGLLSARGAPPTEELLTAWAELDKCDRVIRLLESKRRRAVADGKDSYVRHHTTDRIRLLGRRRRAVAAVRRADARIVRALGAVLGGLASLGYDAQWCGLRAADVGAPHGRFRIFILAWPAAAHSPDLRGEGGQPAWRRGAGHADRGGRPPAADAGGEHRRGSRVAAPGEQAARWALGEPAGRRGTPPATGCAAANTHDATRDGQRPCPEPGERGVTTAADAERRRRHGRPREEVGRQGAGTAAAGRGPRADALTAATDTAGDRRPCGGHPDRRPSAPAWGPYEPAIRRWEAVLGRVASPPTEPGARGNPRLAPAFVEWMQGLPAGHVTDPAIGISRNDMLRALGNTVVPQQAAEAVRWLLLEAVAQDAAA